MNPSTNHAPIAYRSKPEQAATAAIAPDVRRPRRAAVGAARTTHRFRPTTCPRCHSVTLHGIAAEGLTVHLDPTPLDPTTEASSLVAGRATWHMTRDLEVCWRTASKITHRPAGNHTDLAVFAEHACHNPIPATISGWAWGPHAPAPTSEEPGF